jgi:predicted membrane protein
LFSPIFPLLLLQFITGYGVPRSILHFDSSLPFFMLAFSICWLSVAALYLLLNMELVIGVCQLRDTRRLGVRSKQQSLDIALPVLYADLENDSDGIEDRKRPCTDEPHASAPPQNLSVLGTIKLIWPALFVISLSIIASVGEVRRMQHTDDRHSVY